MTNYPETLTLEIGREQTAEIISALRAARNDLADVIESKAARTFSPLPTANGFDEAAAAIADPSEIVSRAADALSDLSALVESGSVRLTAYPSELPSLDELASAAYGIGTARTFSHDQLVAFSRIAGDAADGHFADGNGAVAAIALASAVGGLAMVTVDGRHVATIDSAGDVTYFSATTGEAI